MNSYWKYYYDSNSRQSDGSLLKQVGKTVNGRDISELQMKLIVQSIANILRLTTKDLVVDLCCGNGLITERLAPRVRRVIGVDFTPGLIKTAKMHNTLHNIDYIISDVLRLDSGFFLGLKKVVMYEALQHFSPKQFAKLLDELRSLDTGSLVLLGSIPNKEKLKVYYDTEEKYAFYVKRESEGKPHIGRWWSIEEIERLVSMRGFKVIPLPQEPTLYTAYYRFNVLLERCR